MAGLGSSPVPRVGTKAIVSPPGEKVGEKSFFGWRVRRRAAPAPGSSSHRSWLPVFSAVSGALTTKASRRASGDQVRSEIAPRGSACSRGKGAGASGRGAGAAGGGTARVARGAGGRGGGRAGGGLR